MAQSEKTLAEERESTVTGLFEPDAGEVARFTPEELAAQLAGPHPPLVLDVRSRAHYEHDEGQIPGSMRVLPDQIEEWAKQISKERPIVAYCT